MTDTQVRPQKDKPWLFRTYAGHSTARASNALYRNNLSKGQTGLSVAFDLPTQTGYDSDHELSKGEVGKVGVPICHLGDMRLLFDQIPLEQMNTSMTINATAPVVAGAVYRGGGRAGRRCQPVERHGAERPYQGIPVARHLYLPAPALYADDYRCRGLYARASAQMEPDECLFLPPARGGRDTAARTGLRAGDGLCGAGRSENQGSCRTFPADGGGGFRFL